jgi:hypothetical protein
LNDPRFSGRGCPSRHRYPIGLLPALSAHDPRAAGRSGATSCSCAFRPFTAASSNRMTPSHHGGPNPDALIRIRDRLAARAEALEPTARWCVCPHLHHPGDDSPRSLRSVPAASQGPSETLLISKPSLRKYIVEIGSRRGRVSFELHDRRPIVAAIEGAVLDPSPETYVVPQFSPDL